VARAPGRPQAVSDSVFLVATSTSWPRPAAAYAADKIPWRADDVPRCGSGTPLITNDSLGPLLIGETQADLRKRCPHLLHVWVLERDGEPAIALKVGDAHIVARLRDTMPNATVRLIAISDPTPRTAEGFGVGTRALDLVTKHRDETMISGGESCILFFRSLPGLTFVLNPKDCKRLAPGKQVHIEQLFSAEAKVTEIWIKGSH